MRRAIDIDEGVVVALVGEVARALLIDVGVYISQFGANIGHIAVMRVDDMMSFFDYHKELCQLGYYLLIERLLYLIEIVSPCNQNAYRIDILFPLVRLIPILVFA
jgi:hypothetical protein